MVEVVITNSALIFSHSENFMCIRATMVAPLATVFQTVPCKMVEAVRVIVANLRPDPTATLCGEAWRDRQNEPRR